MNPEITTTNIQPASYNDLALPLADSSPARWLQWMHLERSPRKISLRDLACFFRGAAKVDHIPDSTVISLKINNTPAWLEAPISFIDQLCKTYQSDIALQSVPEAYQGMFVEAALSELIDRLEEKCGSTIELGHIYNSGTDASEKLFDQQTTPDYQVVGFNFDSGDDTSYPVRIKIAQTQLAKVGRLFSDTTVAASKYPHLQAPVHCLFATETISNEERRSLERGDCILLKSRSSASTFVMLHLPQNRKAAGTLHNNTLRVTAEPEDDMQKTLPLGEDVTLEFYFGDTTMSIADLSALTTGSTIELNVGPSPISVFANRHPIGNGHLVDIDDCIAVRIDELF